MKKMTIILLLLMICVIPFFWYLVEVKPHVDTEINSFNEKISQIKDPKLKIQKIADFTEDNYYQTYGKKANYSLILLQIFDDPQKIRIRSPIFSLDPYLIAYFKTGACGESASLFNFYANKLGIESRIVGTRAEDHQWNEVKINNSWIQVDPTIYYYYYIDPTTYPTYKDLWLDNTHAYSELQWYGGYSTISAFGTDEDLTAKYCNTSILTINCQDCSYIKIRPENGVGNSIDKEFGGQESTFILGKKAYTILADKPIIPYLLLRQSNTSISLLEKNSVKITLNPEEIKPSLHLLLIVTLVSCALLIAMIFFCLKTLIKIFQKSIKKPPITDSQESEKEK